VAVAINQRTNAIEVFLNDGKRETSEDSLSAKCAYSNPLEMNTILLTLRGGQLSVQILPEQQVCGSVDFLLSRFYLGLSSVSLNQPCVSSLHSLVLETPDPIPALQLIEQCQQDMDLELKDVLGELKELNGEYG
jgi:hypothetical protein